MGGDNWWRGGCIQRQCHFDIFACQCSDIHICPFEFFCCLERLAMAAMWICSLFFFNNPTSFKMTILPTLCQLNESFVKIDYDRS